MLPLPILIALGAVGAFILLSPAAPWAPPQATPWAAPPAPTSPQPGSALPYSSNPYLFAGSLGGASMGSGVNADEVAPWYIDPWGLGGVPVPLSNYDAIGPASHVGGGRYV